MSRTKEAKLKKLPAKAVKANTAVIEDLFLNSNLDMSYLDSPYAGNRDGQLVDVAIATLAQYGNDVLLSDILEVEELEHSTNWDALQIRVLTDIYALWVDKKAIINREDNLLRKPDHTSGWKAMFQHEVVTKLLIPKGQLMAHYRSIYGWQDWNSKFGEGPKAPAVVAAFNLKEDHWADFAGTFVTEDDSKSGFSLHVMYADGTFRDLRYEGNMSQVMKELG